MERVIESFTPDQLRQLKAVLDTHKRELELDDEQRSDRTELVSEADAEQSSSKRKADAVDKDDQTERSRMAPALREPLAPRQDLGVDNTFGRDAKAKAMSSIHTQMTVPVVLHKPGSNKPTAKRNTSNKVKILNPKTILTRFLQRLMPDENILLAARRSCLLFYKNNNETPVYHRALTIIDDPDVRELQGDERCNNCKSYADRYLPPPGMEQWPCLSVENGGRCTFCVIGHAAGCSLLKPAAIRSDAPLDAKREAASGDTPIKREVSGRGRVGRQKKSFISQMRSLIAVSSDWCKEMEDAEEQEEVPELMADALKEIRRQMRSLEEIAGAVAE